MGTDKIMETIGQWNWSNILGWLIPVLISGAGVVYKRRQHPRRIARRHTIPSHRVSPQDIMGDRGREQNGFRAQQYLRRPVDSALNEELPHCHLVVLTGLLTSGKSRAVYEYVRTGPFARIYPAHKYRTCYKQEIEHLPDDVLIVFDEIDELWENGDPRSMKETLGLIHDRGLHAVATLSETAPRFDEFIELCRRGDDFRGRQKASRIPCLSIPPIEKDDEVHDWCTANLHPELFSQAIGAYLPELRRYFTANIAILLSDEHALTVLTAYTILAKYRREKSKEVANVQKLHDRLVELLQQEELLSDSPRKGFQRSLNKVCQLRFLARSGQSLAIADVSLYNQFLLQCRREKSGNPIIERLLLSDAETERNQVEVLIGIDPDDPEYYARAVTKAQHKESTIPFVEQRLLQRFFRTDGGKLVLRDPDREAALVEPISCIVGRSGLRYAETLQKYIDAGVRPSIMTVGELLRIALILRNHRLRDEVLNYAEELRREYGLQPDIYYYQRHEEVCRELYDPETIARVCELYRNGDQDPTSDRGRANADSIRRYSNVLLGKAVTEELMDRFFDEILPAHPELIITKAGLHMQMEALCRNRSASTDPLLRRLVDKLGKIVPDRLPEEALRSVCIGAIGRCRTFAGAKSIYDAAADPSDQKSFNILTFELFKKIATEADYETCLPILRQRVADLKSIGYDGAALKLFNVLLNNVPADTSQDALQRAWELLADTGIGLEQRDIYSVLALQAIALKLHRRATQQCDLGAGQESCATLARNTVKIEEFRRDRRIRANVSYLSGLYTVCVEMRQFGCDNTEIRTLAAGIATPDLSNSIIDSQRIVVEEELFERFVREYEHKVLSEKRFVDPDTITHLIKRALKSDDAPLQRRVAAIAAHYLSRHVVSIHFYCQMLKFDLKRGVYGAAGALETDRIEAFIRDAFRQLDSYQLPLVEHNSDLLCSAIASEATDYDEAFRLAVCVGQLAEERRAFRNTLRPDAIVLLCKKLRRHSEACSGEEIRAHVDGIQELIDRLADVRFALDDQKRISAHLRKISENSGIKLFIAYPLTKFSDHRLRHETWDRLYHNGSLSDAYDNDILTFAKIEIHHLIYLLRARERGVGSGEFVECRSYLIGALDELRDRGIEIRRHEFVNRDGYLRNTRRPASWDHPDFFRAFAEEGCIAAEDEAAWQELAAFHGYPLPEA